MALKPQDIVVILKILAARSRRPPYAQLAVELGMSSSEVHASVKRAKLAGLLHGPELEDRPNMTALDEFLVHGLKYVFPAVHGELTRGVPTSYAAEPLSRVVTPSGDPAPVWPYPQGKSRGAAFHPLYRTAPAAALRDRAFYEYLTLVDALRDGRTRERKYAEQELRRRFRGVNERRKS